MNRWKQTLPPSTLPVACPHAPPPASKERAVGWPADVHLKARDRVVKKPGGKQERWSPSEPYACPRPLSPLLLGLQPHQDSSRAPADTCPRTLAHDALASSALSSFSCLIHSSSPFNSGSASLAQKSLLGPRLGPRWWQRVFVLTALNTAATSLGHRLH